MSDSKIEEIYNYLEISPRLATSGQPTREQFAAIRDAGYEVVINLATADGSRALKDEASVVQNAGMEYIHIPVVWEDPTSEDLAAFFDAMQRNADRRVYVHCIANMRVSAFMYLYHIVEQGMEPDEAEEQMARIWQPNALWRNFIDDELARRGIEIWRD